MQERGGGKRMGKALMKGDIQGRLEIMGPPAQHSSTYTFDFFSLFMICKAILYSSQIYPCLYR